MHRQLWNDWRKRLHLKGLLPSRRRRAKAAANRRFEMAVAALRPGDIAIDGGANVGRYTRMLAASGATVHAFEPDPYAFGELTRAVAGSPNVRLYQQAVGIEAGRVHLFRAKEFEADPQQRSLSSSVYASKTNVDATDGIAVEQIDLVDFIAVLPRQLALLKLDVEGAEVPLLEALLDRGVIDRVDHVFVETHERKVPELARRTRALRARVAREGRGNIVLDWA